MERRSYIVSTEVFLGQPSWEVMRVLEGRRRWFRTTSRPIDTGTRSAPIAAQPRPEPSKDMFLRVDRHSHADR
jgi:hypothetical protein